MALVENYDGQYDPENATKKALDPQNWAITARSLHITGQGYDFGVGRDFIEIDIPWKDFGEVVAPQFLSSLQ